MNKIYNIVWSAVRGAFVVPVTARDSSGNEASTRVVLNFTGKGETAR